MLEQGKLYRNFEIKKMTWIPDLNSWLFNIEHLPTGAQIIDIKNDDIENLFCISIKSIPYSSNGVAHILEHLVLRGSDKYPINNLFFAMKRRSLSTYMNALTGDDFTCYTASSLVEKDFYHLFEVYLDAVFNPNLNELSFQQEGYHLEFSNPQDSTTPLKFNGIVYNEMKGVMASSERRLLARLNHLLYPDNTYGFNSGGDPKEIIKLNFDELCQFHRKHYHPARALFYFYGHIPIERHLDYLEDNFLHKYDKLVSLPLIELQKRYNLPISVKDYYPATNLENPQDSTQVCIAWVTCHILEQEELLALFLIKYCLMDNDASVLKRNLLDSKLCKQVSMSIDGYNNEIPVWFTFRRCAQEDSSKIENLLLNNLKIIVKNGIDLDLVDSSLHQLRFELTEINRDSLPFGLQLYLRSIRQVQHGVPIEDSLMVQKIFAKIKEKIINEPRYLESLIEKYFINNNHRVTLSFIPDSNLLEKERIEEQLEIQKIETHLSNSDRKKIVQKSIARESLSKNQKFQNSDILPILDLENIPRECTHFPLEIYSYNNSQVFYNNSFTNQIAYLDYLLPLCEVKEEELPYVQLLISIICEMGCKNYSFLEMLSILQSHTGGIETLTAIHCNSKNNDTYSIEIGFRGKAFNKNLSKLCEIITNILQGVRLDEWPRLVELIQKQWTRLQNTFIPKSMHYATNLSHRSLNVAGKISYEWYGLGYYNFVRSLVKNLDSINYKLINMLKELHTRLFHGNLTNLVVTCDENTFRELVKHDFYGLLDLPKHSFLPWKDDINLSGFQSQGKIITSPVAFISMTIPTKTTFEHPDAPAMSVAPFLMDNIVLYNAIREKGGAYGCGAISDLAIGSFSLYSLRDPNICKTFQTFDRAVETILRGNFTPKNLYEAKLRRIQIMDTPISPGKRGFTAYTEYKESKSIRSKQQFRDTILKLKPNDISEAVDCHISNKMKEAYIAVLTNRELLEKENLGLKSIGKSQLQIMEI